MSQYQPPLQPLLSVTPTAPFSPRSTAPLYLFGKEPASQGYLLNSVWEDAIRLDMYPHLKVR